MTVVASVPFVLVILALGLSLYRDLRHDPIIVRELVTVPSKEGVELADEGARAAEADPFERERSTRDPGTPGT